MDSQTPEMEQPSGRVPKVWGSRVPLRNKDFTGRMELLEELHEALHRTRSGGDQPGMTAIVPYVSATPTTLQGMGGVGKTQVAIEYAHRYQEEYDLVWWISADQPKLVAAALAGLAEPLKLTVRSTGIAEVAQAVLDALRLGRPYSRWLLIYDNANRPEDITGLIPGGSGHILITSRNQAWKNRFKTIAVDVFNRPESVEFLHKRVQHTISDKDAARLAEELGDLPLALEQASALQIETGMTVDEYLELLGKQPAALLEESPPSEYPRPMTAAWQLSVSQLTEQLPEAVELLRACAFFGPEPIPLDVFRRRSLQTGPRLSEILGNAILRARAVRTLGRFALGRIDPKARTIQVHRLVQALLREALDGDVAAEFQRDVHLLLAGAASGNPDEERNWHRYEELVPHLDPAGVMDSDDPEVRKFARRVVRYLYRSGDYNLGRTFVDQLLERWTDVSDAEHPDVLLGESLLANILREQGEYQRAYDIDESLLQRAEEILAERPDDLLPIVNSFGADLRARGEFGRALRHDERSRARHEEKFGENDPRTLRAIHNLALDYGLNSQYEDSRRLHELAFNAMSEATEGISLGDVLNSWTGLARAVRLRGDYLEARDLGLEAYEYGIKEMRPDHPTTLRAAKDLSIAQRRAGQYEEALELSQEVYERFERLLGKDNPDTMAAAMGLSNILRTVGRTREAYELAQDTMARYPKAYGNDHPYNYGCAGNVALLSRVRGMLREARQLNQNTLDTLRTRVGPDHHYTLTIATNLASDIYEMDDAQQARALSEDTLPRLRQLLGADHPLTLGCAANLSVYLVATGGAEEAEDLHQETIARYDRTLGRNHPDTIVARDKRRLDFDFDPPPI